MGKVLCVSKDAGDWGVLAPVAKALKAKGVEIFFAVDARSVSAEKRLPGSGFEGKAFENASEVLSHLGGGTPPVVLSGMSSLLGRELTTELRGKSGTWIAGLPVLPDEYYHLWPTGPDALFVHTDEEATSINNRWRWGGSTRGIKTGYSHLDSFPAAVAKLDRDEIRKNLGLGPGDKLVWVAMDKKGLGPALEMILGAFAALRMENLVVFPNFHPAAPDDEKRAAEKVIDTCGLRLITDGNLFGAGNEPRFVAVDGVIGALLSTMPYQAHATGCPYIGIALKGDLEKQAEVIGSERVSDNFLVTGGHIACAASQRELEALLPSMLSGKLGLNPLPPLDGKSTERVVQEVLKHL